MKDTPVVHVVDDDESLRTATMRLLKAAGYRVVGYASAGDFLLAETAEAPGCLLLDVNMPGPTGLDLQEALASRGHPIPVVFLTGHGDIPMSVRAMRGGAIDFLTKPVSKDALLEAVQRAIRQSLKNRDQVERLGELRRRYDTLTEREREVLQGVVAGKMNKQIAAELHIAERTVKAHRAQIVSKLQVGSVAELVRVAGELGLAE